MQNNNSSPKYHYSSTDGDGQTIFETFLQNYNTSSPSLGIANPDGGKSNLLLRHGADGASGLVLSPNADL